MPRNTCLRAPEGRTGFIPPCTPRAMLVHSGYSMNDLHLHTVLPDQGNATDLKICLVSERHLHLNACSFWASHLLDPPVQ